LRQNLNCSPKFATIFNKKDDIKARKTELDNLVKQKESVEINQGTEIERLKTLDKNINSESEKIEKAYQSFLLTA
jgi:glutathione synthase/RimK-type ligase-like ATP-grasp enzyme